MSSSRHTTPASDRAPLEREPVDRHRDRARRLSSLTVAPRPESAYVKDPVSWRERLARWRDLPEADLQGAPATARFIVVDVEPTGLDPSVNRLRAIGAGTVEDYARRMISAEEIHAGEVDKMLRKPGAVAKYRTA